MKIKELKSLIKDEKNYTDFLGITHFMLSNTVELEIRTNTGAHKFNDPINFLEIKAFKVNIEFDETLTGFKQNKELFYRSFIDSSSISKESINKHINIIKNNYLFENTPPICLSI